MRDRDHFKAALNQQLHQSLNAIEESAAETTHDNVINQACRLVESNLFWINQDIESKEKSSSLAPLVIEILLAKVENYQKNPEKYPTAADFQCFIAMMGGIVSWDKNHGSKKLYTCLAKLRGRNDVTQESTKDPHSHRTESPENIVTINKPVVPASETLAPSRSSGFLLGLFVFSGSSIGFALLGAMIGSAFPGVGTLLGFVVGLAVGALAGSVLGYKVAKSLTNHHVAVDGEKDRVNTPSSGATFVSNGLYRYFKPDRGLGAQALPATDNSKITPPQPSSVSMTNNPPEGNGQRLSPK